MVRAYSSPLREKRARQTRDSIVAAARKLHVDGVTELPAIAEAAGVAIATVYKHFPTKEALFQETSKGLLEPLGHLSVEVRSVSGKDTRLVWGVHRLFELMEGDLGWLWTSYRTQEDSEVMAGLVRRYETLVANIGVGFSRELIDSHGRTDAEPLVRYVCALLHPLTYRAMRTAQQLSVEAATAQTIDALSKILTIRVGINRREPFSLLQFQTTQRRPQRGNGLEDTPIDDEDVDRSASSGDSPA